MIQHQHQQKKGKWYIRLLVQHRVASIQIAVGYLRRIDGNTHTHPPVKYNNQSPQTRSCCLVCTNKPEPGLFFGFEKVNFVGRGTAASRGKLGYLNALGR